MQSIANIINSGARAAWSCPTFRGAGDPWPPSRLCCSLSPPFPKRFCLAHTMPFARVRGPELHRKALYGTFILCWIGLRLHLAQEKFLGTVRNIRTITRFWGPHLFKAIPIEILNPTLSIKSGWQMCLETVTGLFQRNLNSRPYCECRLLSSLSVLV